MRSLGKVAPLLFFSGLCALVYQVTWLRELRLVFGASTAASAAVLAVFMGGLGLGGALFGKRVDKQKSPLGYYANLEIIVAVTSAATPLLVTLAHRVYTGLGGTVVLGQVGGTIVRLLLAALVLGAPTLAMGGTLPAASRAVETERDAGRASLAVLYGTNTFGAVVGAALANFVLLEVFGNRLTLWMACLVNLLVAVIGRAVARTLDADKQAAEKVGETNGEAPAAEEAAPGEGAGEPRAPGRFVLAAAGIVGFAFLLMELVWYRMLGPVLGGSSYTFGLILAIALFGIGLGGAAYAVSGQRKPATLRGFAFTCALEALFIIVPFAIGDGIAVLSILTRALGGLGFGGLVSHWALIAGIVVLPASIVSGYQFPLLINLLGRGAKDIGRDVGFAYAANTAGSILGSLAGGFGLLPALTALGCWRLSAALLAALAATSLLLSFRLSSKKERRASWSRSIGVASVAVASLLLLFSHGPTAAWRHSPIGAGRSDDVAHNATINGIRAWQHAQRAAIRWEAEGVESSVALDMRGGTAFIVNGKSDGAALGDAPTQVMSGIIGAALHPNPKRSMVVGLGTGSTAGWLGLVPTMERVDVVEIEPAIKEVARACAPVNAGVLDNPKVHLFFGDAREVLSTTRERYDIIFSEPSNPYRAGISSLYTEDFYRAASGRLAEGGIFLQWMQSYEVDGQAVRTVIATISSVFSKVSIWQTQGGDMILLATMTPIEIDADALRQKLDTEPFSSALRHVYRTAGLEAFLAHHVATPSVAREIAGLERFSVSTDDRNLLEFAFARSVGRGRVFDDEEIWGLSRALSASRPEIAKGKVDWALVEEMRILDDTIGIVSDRPDPARVEMFTMLGRWRAGDLAGVARRLAKVPTQEPRSMIEEQLLAEGYAELGDDRALPLIERVRAVEPVEAKFFDARFFLRKNDLAGATTALEAAFTGVREAPWVDKGIVERSFDLAQAISAQSAPFAVRLFEALNKPFVLRLLDHRRLLLALDIASRLPGDECVRVLDDLEPNIPWNGAFLDKRLRCYERHGHPRKAAALADVREFLDNMPPPFMDGFDLNPGGKEPSAPAQDGPSNAPAVKPAKAGTE